MSLFTGPVRQIAFVTRDIRASMEFYTRELGVGPWFTTEVTEAPGLRYHGAPCTAHFSAALAAWGAIQIEFIQQHDDSPSVFRDWMRRPFARELQQHVCHWAEDYDGTIARAQARGFVVEQDGVTPWGPFAYLLHPDNPDQLFELLAITPRRLAFNRAIAAAAVDWDGRVPIRPFADALAIADAEGEE